MDAPAGPGHPAEEKGEVTTAGQPAEIAEDFRAAQDGNSKDTGQQAQSPIETATVLIPTVRSQDAIEGLLQSKVSSWLDGTVL